jgi:hypothetical protein
MFQSGQKVQSNPRSPEMDAGRHCGLCSFTWFETQFWSLDSQHSNTRKSVCLVCF